MSVKALFIDPNGPYPKLLGKDNCWDTQRNAMLYDGSNPIVAHPPCNLWVNFAALNYKRYGGEHNKPGNDGGMFSFALETLRRVGGVLEHPAKSNAWSVYDIMPPPKDRIGWFCNRAGSNNYRTEWICEVWQSAYGHKARKKTWLLWVGPHTGSYGIKKPMELSWSRIPGTHQCGWFDRIKPTLSKKEASKTPEAFAIALIELARQSTDYLSST